ncbi:uncharacterized protein LOC119649200 isoform X3 [Hermetia illucens]|uniref:uncharacterized protein LOC119649200 isoform X3 n=1 Tax=Hermetia illucens TaxID=343691 RepID=UPI0018CC5B79|nr:uncharacterized protein LOC119649200 isoform X3 [Hermetia illucens]
MSQTPLLIPKNFLLGRQCLKSMKITNTYQIRNLHDGKAEIFGRTANESARLKAARRAPPKKLTV